MKYVQNTPLVPTFHFSERACLAAERDADSLWAKTPEGAKFLPPEAGIHGGSSETLLEMGAMRGTLATFVRSGGRDPEVSTDVGAAARTECKSFASLSASFFQGPVPTIFHSKLL